MEACLCSLWMVCCFAHTVRDLSSYIANAVVSAQRRVYYLHKVEAIM
jgi:hypothetical protein